MFDRLRSLIGRPAPPPNRGKGRGKGAKGGPPGNRGTPPKGGKGAPPPGKGAPPRGAPPPEPQAPPPPPGMSLDRKLDLLGIVLAFVGLISGLSLFTANQSPLLAAWLTLLRQAAGWGVYGLPLGFIAVGLWLVLRKFGDKLPRFEPERLVGVILLYLALLATLHFIVVPIESEIFDFVKTGRGGGLFGAMILWALFRAVGPLGSAVLLAAWWIIAIVFTAGLSVPEMVTLVAGWIRRVRASSPIGRQLPLPQPKGKAIGRGEAPNRPAPQPAETPGKPQPAQAGAKSPQPAKAPEQPETIVAGRKPAPGVPLEPAGTATALPPGAEPLVIGAEHKWELPTVEQILDPGSDASADDAFNRERAHTIENTLASFGAPVIVKEINPGPTITQFGVEPDFVEQRGGKKTKVKVSKIAALADDLALALSAQSIRIEAPVPGKGYVGIEVPNVETSLVALRDVMESDAFQKLQGTLRLGLGADVSGAAIAVDLTQMPHLLIAGTTGSGKSVCVNSLITCLLLQNTPDDLKFLMVDPKRVELTSYNGIPHLLAPVVVDLERVVASLQWVMREMDERYRRFAKGGARNIADYNARAATTGVKKLPYLIVVIDELADLMMLAPDETERAITRLAQLARATGIHLIIATQRPSVDVVTGLIKANFPARVAFAVASSVDSRVIIDQPGAERLLGRGDMLLQSPDSAAPLRMQGVFVSDHELHRVVQYWKEAAQVTVALAPLPEATPAAPGQPAPQPMRQQPLWDSPEFSLPEERPDGEDELLDEAIKAVREMKKASISLLQRRLRIGYTRAARLIDVLEEQGIVGPPKPGAQQREVIGYGDSEVNPTAEGTAEKRTWTMRVRSPKSRVRSAKSEVRSPKSRVGSRKS